MRISALSVAQALESLRSGGDGLGAREAARRLAEYGPNRLEHPARQPLWLRFLAEFTHLFALILWAAAALAFAAELRQPEAGMAPLGWAIIVVILVNGGFSFWQAYRAERTLAALARLLPTQVKVMRDGVTLQAEAIRLVPGDVILVQEGDEVPADCRVIESFGLRINEANLTGESLPAEKSAAPDPDAEAGRARNVILAGTLAVAGAGRALVFATGMRTEFGRIAHLTQSAPGRLSPLQREIVRLSRLVAALATALGIGFFLVGEALGIEFWHNFVFAIGVIVANVPEGLLPTVTLSLAMATERMAKRNALIRHLPAVEALGATTAIVSDKTGTLTENKMRVKRLFFAEGARDWAPAELPGPRLLFEVAAHCHDLREVSVDGGKALLGDATEVALLEMARAARPGAPEYARSDEIAFDSDRKRLATLHDTPRGAALYCKGALESVLPLCGAADCGGETRVLDAALRERFVRAENEMAHAGMRVLAFAWRAVPPGTPREALERELVLCGLVGLADPVRAEVPAAVQACHAAGIRVLMVTGDHPQTALAVAREIGLARQWPPRLVTGAELARLTPVQLQFALDVPDIVFARMGADQKLAIVEALQRKGHLVAVTGDGVNDAPALKRADIGIAMGLCGTDVAKESADMVLLDDNFASIVAAIEEGRAVFDNLRKFMTYILTSNVPELIPYLAFALFRIPLPLTVMQILAVDLGTDMLPALALGAERPAPDAMTRAPRARTERLLNWPLLARAYLFLGALEAAAAMAAYFFVLLAAGWQFGVPLAAGAPLYLEATTACFAAIVVTQVVNVFLCRHPETSSFAFGLFSNRLILWGVACELALALAIVYTPLGNRVFGTAALAPEAWLFMLPFAAAMIALEEARKGWLRGRTRIRAPAARA